MKGNKGFTIVEMLIVIVIMAILATVAVPNIISWRANATLSGDTRTLKADFELARSTAIKNNTTATITFDTGNNRYSITSGGDTVLSRNLTNTSIIGTALAVTGNETIFDSRGRTDNTGNVTLSNGSRNTKVSISMIGSVRVN
ncbi:MAG: GspH/FimT family pseudopilin [Pseudomonadota bacterium]